MSHLITCPLCNKQTEIDKKNPYRPFCSERCKLIDLGQWADESYKIPESKQNIFSNNDSDDLSKKH